jgi:hypothetical protein
VTPAPSEAVTEGLRVVVNRVSSSKETTEVAIPFGTERRDDATLTKGTTKELQAGTTGLVRRTAETVVVDGTVESKAVVAEQRLREPVSRVLAGRHQAGAEARGRRPRARRRLRSAPVHRRCGQPQLGRARPVRERRQPAHRQLQRAVPRPVPVLDQHLAQRRRLRHRLAGLAGRADLPGQAALQPLGRRPVADLRTSPVRLVAPVPTARPALRVPGGRASGR